MLVPLIINNFDEKLINTLLTIINYHINTISTTEWKENRKIYYGYKY